MVTLYKRSQQMTSLRIQSINDQRGLSESLKYVSTITTEEALNTIKGNLKKDLIKILSELKPKINLSKKKIKEIKKDFNKLKYRFSKSKISEFRRSLYNIKNQKNLSTPEIKETEKNLLELEESLYNLKKHCDHDDTEYQVIRGIKNLFSEVDEDYYKPI